MHLCSVEDVLSAATSAMGEYITMTAMKAVSTKCIRTEMMSNTEQSFGWGDIAFSERTVREFKTAKDTTETSGIEPDKPHQRSNFLFVDVGLWCTLVCKYLHVLHLSAGRGLG